MTGTERVVLVTGAARGIGAATVAELLDTGHRVIAIDSCRGADSGLSYPLATREDLAAVARLDPARVEAIEADVADEASVRQAVAAGVDRFGRLDAVVAAAGVIAGGAPLWETPVEDLQTQWSVNALGVWHTAAACVPVLLAQPDPSDCRFVAVVSAAGSRGLFHLAAYNASKHAALGIIRGLAADLVGTGVTAVAVSPGSTDTAMLAATAGIYGLTDPAELAESQLIKRTIEPAEMAATIAFCCSPAGGVLNGSVVAADGGFSG
ncbi:MULTISPECIES: mycofactocin-coupled SDR family oxidoreductase [unclassified Nocardioides]|uniref:mycofactocin-coupled SDR family oxidoreductase n=1 Tax=unclassified Nocardioides TaxID=2615069 RepID=UPI0007009F60|nr:MULTISPECIES: mycofactocin-coupled SDR family oxidoreductase [unclassified Nocardioides]KQY50088.1 oxidoreductase [Nocardioides sp. Root140]KQZ75712.1 oxidoreductase [Nocardioides sp. Root151]KRF14784.1 oxidoreductase [Nocardioides sp. Soil796]